MQLKIGFARATGFVPLAWAIELTEGTPYSHIYFRWDNSGVDTVFETTVANGTTQVTASAFQTGYKILEEYGFELSDDDFTKYRAFCLKYKGEPYALKQLVGAAIAKLLGLKANPLAQTGSVVCAELLLLLMQTLPDAFPGEAEIKKNPNLVGLRVLRDFIAKNKNATKTA